MKIWYSCKVKHNRELDDGMLKQVTDAFLLDAVSYTDAESRLYEICERDIRGEFTVTQITKTNIAEVVEDDAYDKYFKCKVVYATVDGDSDKEVKINTYLLVSAEHVKQAFEKVEEHLNAMLVPFEIPSITLTTFLEVFPYESNAEGIPSNLKPLSESEEN
ncbi:MAG: DUF4494 domain-containing protein [Cyclobacteriaceae bacterium]